MWGGCIFLLGNYVAESIRKDTFSGRILFTVGLVLFGIKSVTPLKRTQLFCDVSVGMLSISMIFLCIIFLKHCGHLCRRMLAQIGSVSLESYLFNIFLLQAVKYWGDIFLSNTGFLYRLILYIVISFLGITFSFCSKMIMKSFLQ